MEGCGDWFECLHRMCLLSDEEAINGTGTMEESPVDGKGRVAGWRYKVRCRFGSSCSVV